MIRADCWKCAEAESDRLEAEGRWIESMSFGMYVCPQCGNKRCPKATDHDLPCGGSNEPGQPGSRYEPTKPNHTQGDTQNSLEEWLAELKQDLRKL